VKYSGASKCLCIAVMFVFCCSENIRRGIDMYMRSKCFVSLNVEIEYVVLLTS